jgi:hypothetical protein
VTSLHVDCPACGAKYVLRGDIEVRGSSRTEAAERCLFQAQEVAKDLAGKLRAALAERDRLAAEVLALRGALAQVEAALEAVRLAGNWQEFLEHADPLLAPAYEAVHAALARPLPDAVKRLEAEARVGRAEYVIRQAEARNERPTSAQVAEYEAALDAIRALDHGLPAREATSS